VVVVVLGLREPVHIVWIDQVRHRPTIQVILCHAGVDEGLHTLGETGGVSNIERNEAVFFGGPGIVDLILKCCSKTVPDSLRAA